MNVVIKHVPTNAIKIVEYEEWLEIQKRFSKNMGMLNGINYYDILSFPLVTMYEGKLTLQILKLFEGGDLNFDEPKMEFEL